jgi:hypothetical protein
LGKEFFSLFSAIFNGHHASTADATEPMDSGVPFSPSPAVAFLDDLPRLSQEERDSLEVKLGTIVNSWQIDNKFIDWHFWLSVIDMPRSGVVVSSLQNLV